MFRRTRILQAVLPALLATACASQQAVHEAPSAGPVAATTAGTAALTPHPAIPDIEAGKSEVSSRPFVNSDGRLQDDIEDFAREVSRLRQLPPDHVRALLQEAQYNATAARLMSPAKTRIRRSWVTYRNRFVEPIRIRDG